MKPHFYTLVIYFLLFSCSHTNEMDRLNDSIIENYDQLQSSTIELMKEGNQSLNEMVFEKKMYRKSNWHPLVWQKYNVTFEQAEKIDKATLELIQQIEKIKYKLLEGEGENLNRITTEKINPSKIETIIPLNLRKIQHKNSTNAVNKILISENEGQLSVTSNKLWKALAKYRKKIITDLACYEYGPEKYLLKYTNFTNYKSKKELGKKISLWLSSSKINRDDEQVIKDIYLILDFSKINNQHWINYTFKDIPITQAITNLTLLENKILLARNNAFKHLNIRLYHCCFRFTKLIPITSGPSLINQGEDFEIKVMFAAYDEDEVPKVEVFNENSSVVENSGFSIVKVRKIEKSGIQTIKGKIYVQNNSGEITPTDWEWKVNVIPRK